LADAEIVEVILATDPNLEGEATATYLSRLIKPMEIKVSRSASGLPVGGDWSMPIEVYPRRIPLKAAGMFNLII